MATQWRVQCVNRETGVETTETVAAQTEQDARKLLAERGLLVGNMAEIREPPDMSPTVGEAVNKMDDTVTDTLDSLTIMGFLGTILLLAGIITVIYGAMMDTAPEGTHNLGLLVDRIVTVIIGCTVLLTSMFMFVIRAIMLNRKMR